MEPVDSAVRDEEPAVMEAAAMLPAVSELVPILCTPETMEPTVIAPAVVKFRLLAIILPAVILLTVILPTDNPPVEVLVALIDNILLLFVRTTGVKVKEGAKHIP